MTEINWTRNLELFANHRRLKGRKRHRDKKKSIMWAMEAMNFGVMEGKIRPSKDAPTKENIFFAEDNILAHMELDRILAKYSNKPQP